MKTAEEQLDRIIISTKEQREDYLAIMRDIQLDAFKEGMQRAAEELGPEPQTSYAAAKRIILTAAEQLTLEDLNK